MVERRGVDVLLDVLRSEGVTHLFGNPGTTELPLIDALAGQPELEYILGLQEATVVGMADGYAQATGRPAFVNLHTSAGLGNAIGNLTNARANGAPLVITAGNADRRHLIADPLLSGDLVGLARGAVKWGHEARHAEELGTVLRRAFLDAAAPPPGPVFVALPSDVLDAPTSATVPPRSVVRRDSVAGGLDRLAELLTSVPPSRLALVAGEEVAATVADDEDGEVGHRGEVGHGGSAVGEMVALAETLGCRVHGSPLYSAQVFPPGHAQWAGALPARADGIRAALAGYRVVFLVGAQAFLVYPYTPGSPLPEDTALAHLSADPGAPGRTHPVTLGLVGGVQATLRALIPQVAARVDAGAVREERERQRREAAGAEDGFEALARSRYAAAPMHPMGAVHALLRGLPADVTVVDEAITAGSYVRGLHRPVAPGRYFFCRGGGLGWAMPAAVGISLARGRDRVLCVVGDGSALYSPQALWTAARHRLPVLFAVINNRSYAILKQNLPPAGVSAAAGRTVGLDVDDPAVDFLALGRSMGVPAVTVDRADDIGDAARAAWDRDGPSLIELPVTAR